MEVVWMDGEAAARLETVNFDIVLTNDITLC